MRAADADAEPENTRPAVTWRQAVKQWGISRSKQVHRVAVQGYQRAVQAGRVAARKVITVQKAAGLPEHLMRRSAKSVEIREPARPSDAAWTQGYMQVAGRTAAREPALAAADREPFEGLPVRIVRTPQPKDPEAGQ